MARQFIISASFVFLLLQFSCKTNPVEPPIKNPREFTFTIDTLTYPGSFQTTMYDIWASGSASVWIVGHNDQNRGLMWYFDGSRWTDIKLSTTQGGSIDGPIDLNEVFGFNSLSVFAIGRRIFSNSNPPPNFLDSSLIIHFDGRQWQEEPIQRGKGLWSISGTSPQDIWTCGSSGTLFHYDGAVWKKDSVPLSVPPDAEYSLWDIKSAVGGNVFMIGAIRQNNFSRTTYYFFRRDDKWDIIDSFTLDGGQTQARFGVHGLWIDPEGGIYSFGSDIFRWIDSSWFKLYGSPNALRKMAGSSKNNVFAVGDFGTVLHYNGSDWYEFKELKNPNLVYSSVWSDGKEVYIVGYLNDGSKTVVLHGH